MFGENYNPTEDEILKYKLWKEQGCICLYTGKTINLTDLFDSNKYDIEHTIPQSVGGDSTDMNLTVCDSEYNRKVKRAQIPSQMANHEEIMERISHWKEEIETLEKKIRRGRDIVERYILDEKCKYLKGKYNRFTMTEVPDGFSLRQAADAQIIARYARQYLKSLFKHVYVVKGKMTSEFRMMWGLQEEYTKKERVNHCHHAIDAITIACIGMAEYDQYAHYIRLVGKYKEGFGGDKPVFPKPWKTFTQDVKHIEDSLLVSHYTADNMGKQTRKRVRKDGKLTGELMQGNTARYSLHQDTYYGAIERNGEKCYVVRKPLDTLEGKKSKDTEKNIKNIVDDAVRQKVQEAFDKYGSLKKAVAAGDVWMNKEKRIPINKVRILTPLIKRPLHIRQQRDTSRKEYKRTFHVANDFNYIMGIYVGIDSKGKPKRDFILVNSLDAVRHANGKRSEELLPTEKNGYPVKWKLKIGAMVLLYEKTPDEIYKADSKELQKRLYKVTGLSSKVVQKVYNYGTLTLLHCQEARPAGDIPTTNGLYEKDETATPKREMLHTQFNALVQGQDFTMNDLGEITFLNHD